MGMLFGLSMLAFNLQRFFEIILTHVFLFFESKSMKKMVKKNLAAHRMRNKMTSLIYSIALGFIIFLLVSFKLQMTSDQMEQLRPRGAYFRLFNRAKNKKMLMPELLDPVLKKHENIIRSFTFSTHNLPELYNTTVDYNLASDAARVKMSTLDIYGVQPSLYDAMINEFWTIHWQDLSKLSITEQLYTARGS